MWQMLIIPVLLGAGMTFDFINAKIDDYEDEARDHIDDQDAQDNSHGGTIEPTTPVTQPDANGDAPDAEPPGPVTTGTAGIQVSGNAGGEIIIGTDDNDTLFGGEGSDTIAGGPGDDRVFLGNDHDVSVPNAAQDDAGNDFIRGGAGADLIADTQGSNQVFGDVGNDTIVSIDGLTETGEIAEGTEFTPDTIHGGYGSDILVADAGDQVTGGVDTDHFIIAAPSQDEYAPAVITDFDANTEVLSIVFLDEQPDDLTVSFVHDANAGVLHAMIEGEEVATLSNLDSDDIPFITAYATTFQDLMAGDVA